MVGVWRSIVGEARVGWWLVGGGVSCGLRCALSVRLGGGVGRARRVGGEWAMFVAIPGRRRNRLGLLGEGKA